MTNRSTIVLFLALAPLTFGSVYADGHEAAPEVIAVKFHGDWCGSCKKMGPVSTDLGNKLDGMPVLFVELDLTNNTTKHQAKLLASALSLGTVYEGNPGTGFILLVDADSKKVVKKLTADMTLKQMQAAIQGLIAS